jgi:hypothetical protein
VIEPQYRLNNGRLRPFATSARVSARGCSLPMQRALTDLAADQPYAIARLKMREHYGFGLGESSIRRYTQAHAEAMFLSDKPDGKFPEAPGVRGTIIAQTDGGMVPITTSDANATDRRKGKKLLWRELRLTLSHLLGSCSPVFAGAIEGGVKDAGLRLLSSAVRVGFGTESRVHAVGDGAKWIAGQVDEQFGDQGSYLIDFFHLCEYLAAAAATVEPDPKAREAWMSARKEEMKTGRMENVLAALSAHVETEEKDDADAERPVSARLRYMTDRPGQFKYREALEARLPIGSGEIESAHRYVVQKRLKLPGAWWTVENAEHMVALRIVRLNGDWDEYWKTARANPPKPANQNRRRSALAA